MGGIAELIAQGETTYTLRVDDSEKSLLRLLQFLKKCGNDGHSVTLEERGDQVKFGFDGDGADKIFDIQINGRFPQKETLVAANRIAASVYRREVPPQYRKLKFLGAGATTVAYEKDADHVLIFTRDTMKMDWLMRQGYAKILDEYTSYGHPSKKISEIPITVAVVPRFQKLSKDNRRLIQVFLKEFNALVRQERLNNRSLSLRNAKEQVYDNLISNYRSRDKHFLEELWDFLSNYDPNQYDFDFGTRNFMEDRDGNIVISDPIVCSELLKLLRDYQKSRYQESL